ncbi:MAG: thioredoxin-disulfide reductase [Actinomycetes bacterium]
MTEHRNVVIIGSGPAGLTAAIYAARADLQPLVVEGEPSSTSDQPGGQLMLTTDVENFPGFPEGVMGPDLMANFRAQAARFGTEIITAKVTKLELGERPFNIWIGRDETPRYTADAVVLATGAQAMMLGLEAERRLMGRGLSACATCDGFFFRDQDICVVGGGDTALEEAQFLTRFARSVTVIHRRDELRASRIMQDRARANEKIKWMWNSVVDDIVGDSQVEGVVVRNLLTDTIETHPFTGMFVAIGHRPNTDLFADQIALEPNGYVRTEGATSLTSVPGVFACGDLQDDRYRQAITAAGSGCMAAIDAERYLEDLHATS